MSNVIVERIIKQFPDFLDHIDVLAGCSGGSLVALGLARGYSPSVIRQLFETTGEKIFTKKTLKNVNVAKYTNKWLKIACNEVWGQEKLSDIPVMKIFF